MNLEIFVILFKNVNVILFKNVLQSCIASVQAIVSLYCYCVLNRFNKATDTSKGKLW